MTSKTHCLSDLRAILSSHAGHRLLVVRWQVWMHYDKEGKKPEAPTALDRFMTWRWDTMVAFTLDYKDLIASIKGARDAAELSRLAVCFGLDVERFAGERKESA